MKILAYRGEHGVNDGPHLCHTRQTAIYFCDWLVANQYALNPNNPADHVVEPKLIKATLSIDNPFVNTPRDPFIEFSHLIEKLGLDEAKRIFHKFFATVRDTNIYEATGEGLSADDFLLKKPDHLKRLILQAYVFLADDEEVTKLWLLGYDGAIHKGSSASSGSYECCVFSEDQVMFQQYMVMT